jgi:hypothetical protein
LSRCETHHLAATAMTSYRRNFVPRLPVFTLDWGGDVTIDATAFGER